MHARNLGSLKIAILATLEISQKLATLKSIQHWQQDKCRWAICRRRRHHCYWPLFVYLCVWEILT